MNKLVKFAMPHEAAIRQNYIAEIMHMTNPNGTRKEYEWGVFCDQDQIYFLAEAAVPGLAELYNADNQENHNGYSDWLNALFNVECAVLEFDGSV